MSEKNGKEMKVSPQDQALAEKIFLSGQVQALQGQIGNFRKTHAAYQEALGSIWTAARPFLELLRDVDLDDTPELKQAAKTFTETIERWMPPKPKEEQDAGEQDGQAGAGEGGAGGDGRVHDAPDGPAPEGQPVAGGPEAPGAPEAQGDAAPREEG